ncbi:conserved hypothetical protein, partial [Ricinus communis]
MVVEPQSGRRALEPHAAARLPAPPGQRGEIPGRRAQRPHADPAGARVRDHDAAGTEGAGRTPAGGPRAVRRRGAVGGRRARGRAGLRDRGRPRRGDAHRAAGGQGRHPARGRGGRPDRALLVCAGRLGRLPRRRRAGQARAVLVVEGQPARRVHVDQIGHRRAETRRGTAGDRPRLRRRGLVPGDPARTLTASALDHPVASRRLGRVQGLVGAVDGVDDGLVGLPDAQAGREADAVFGAAAGFHGGRQCRHA